MKKSLWLGWLCVIILFSGTLCSCNSEPENADSVQLKSWVFRNSISYSYKNSLVEEFINEVSLWNIEVDGMENMTIPDATDSKEQKKAQSFQNACAIFFCTRRYFFPESLNYQKDKDKFSDEFSVFENWDGTGWYRSDKYLEVLQKNLNKSKTVLSNLYTTFCNYLDIVAANEVTMLSYSEDITIESDRYKGYHVEYEVGKGFYVLVKLMEFNDNNRYQVEILYKGDSLSDMQDAYYW